MLDGAAAGGWLQWPAGRGGLVFPVLTEDFRVPEYFPCQGNKIFHDWKRVRYIRWQWWRVMPGRLVIAGWRRPVGQVPWPHSRGPWAARAGKTAGSLTTPAVA